MSAGAQDRHESSASAIRAGITLALDAATGNGSLALLRDGEVVAARDVVMRSADEERFLPAILELLASAGLSLAALDRLVVGAGPGSFTALRVVAATAKGIAQARGIPMFAVPSLALFAAAARSAPSPSAPGGRRVLVALDALRGESYVALVELSADDNVRTVEQLGLIATTELAARATARAAELVVVEPPSSAAGAAAPSAAAAARCLSIAAANGPVDLASWEPVYGRLAEAQVKWEAAHGRALG